MGTKCQIEGKKTLIIMLMSLYDVNHDINIFPFRYVVKKKKKDFLSFPVLNYFGSTYYLLHRSSYLSSL